MRTIAVPLSNEAGHNDLHIQKCTMTIKAPKAANFLICAEPTYGVFS